MSQLTIASPPDTVSEKIKHCFCSLGFYLVFITFLVHAPFLFQLGKRMWALEHYQFFPIILLGSAWLAFHGYTHLDSMKPGHVLGRIIFWALALPLYFTAVRLNSPWIGAISFLASLWATYYSVGGWQLTKAMSRSWIFLWVAIPLPLGIDLQLIQKLQSIATTWASHLLDLFGYHHLVEGVTVIFPHRSFLVEEACSGIHSLFAALACSIFYLLQSNRGLVRSLIIIASAIFWVILANAFRVFLVTVLSIQWDLPVTDGWQHDLIGLLVFVTSLLLIISTDRLLLFFAPIGIWSPAERIRSLISRFWPEDHAEDPYRDKAPRERSTRVNKTFGYVEFSVVAIVFLVLGMGQFSKSTGRSLASTGRPIPEADSLQIDQSFFPEQCNGWKLIDYEERSRKPGDINGQHSSIWYYEKQSMKVAISIDGPFLGWHNLNNCLVGQGWETRSAQNEKYENLIEEMPGGFTHLQARKGVSLYASVFFSVFDENKAALDPPDTYLSFRAIRRFPGIGEFLRQMRGGSENLQDGRQDDRTMQLQLFSESYLPEDEQTREELLALFKEMTLIFTAQQTFSAKESQQ